MKLDWTEVEKLNKPSKREIIEEIDELDDAQLTDVFVQYIDTEIHPGLRPDQKAEIVRKAKERFRKMSGTGTTVLELIEDARKFVARFGPTVDEG